MRLWPSAMSVYEWMLVALEICGETNNEAVLRKVSSPEVDHRKPCRFPVVVLRRGVSAAGDTYSVDLIRACGTARF
jgi:hypothetical protein